MAKVEKFRGKTADELRALPADELLSLMTSRARRAMKRASSKNTVFRKLMKKVQKIKKEDTKKVIKTHVRDAVVIPDWIGLTFGIYNGKEFKNIVITADKVGRRLGEFSHPTTRVIHSGPGVGATRGSKFIPLK